MTATALPNLRYYQPLPENLPTTVEADLVIFGGTSAGIAAAIQMHRLGKKAVIVEFSRFLGGLTTGGLGATDIGNKAAIGGISREFYRRLGKHYGNDENWTFEPSAATRVYADMLAETNVEVFLEQPLKSVAKDGNRITEITTERGTTFRGRMFADATYEGDLFARAGVSYHVGREANSVYRELLNGVFFGHPNHNFKTWVDPYVQEGNPASGLLYGIHNVPPGYQGQGDKCVQAYNFRLCLSLNKNRIPFPMPHGYDPRRYELLLRYINTGIWDAIRLTKMMPNGKTDTNNFGAFSSDHIGANYDWPDGSYARREEMFQDHVLYQAGMMYFLANDNRVPATIREEMATWGLPPDEFTTTSNWPHQLYVREARRMISDYVMTEHECRGYRAPEDVVGMAAYTMDSHNCRRLVIDGRVINEGNVEIGGFSPYGISYRSIVPKQTQIANLLVPVCLSSSHIAYGSIRMEPVFMILGQSAATAAAIAIDANCPVQQVHYGTLRTQLLKDNQVLSWDPNAGAGQKDSTAGATAPVPAKSDPTAGAIADGRPLHRP